MTSSSAPAPRDPRTPAERAMRALDTAIAAADRHDQVAATEAAMEATHWANFAEREAKAVAHLTTPAEQASYDRQATDARRDAETAQLAAKRA